MRNNPSAWRRSFHKNTLPTRVGRWTDDDLRAWSLGNHSTAVGREKPATAASLNPVGTVAASTIGAVLLNEMTAETATVKLNAIPQRCAVPSVFRR